MHNAVRSGQVRSVNQAVKSVKKHRRTLDRFKNIYYMAQVDRQQLDRVSICGCTSLSWVEVAVFTISHDFSMKDSGRMMVVVADYRGLTISARQIWTGKDYIPWRRTAGRPSTARLTSDLTPIRQFLPFNKVHQIHKETHGMIWSRNMKLM